MGSGVQVPGRVRKRKLETGSTDLEKVIGRYEKPFSSPANVTRTRLGPVMQRFPKITMTLYRGGQPFYWVSRRCRTGKGHPNQTLITRLVFSTAWRLPPDGTGGTPVSARSSGPRRHRYGGSSPRGSAPRCPGHSGLPPLQQQLYGHWQQPRRTVHPVQRRSTAGRPSTSVNTDINREVAPTQFHSSGPQSLATRVSAHQTKPSSSCGWAAFEDPGDLFKPDHSRAPQAK